MRKGDLETEAEYSSSSRYTEQCRLYQSFEGGKFTNSDVSHLSYSPQPWGSTLGSSPLEKTPRGGGGFKYPYPPLVWYLQGDVSM